MRVSRAALWVFFFCRLAGAADDASWTQGTTRCELLKVQLEEVGKAAGMALTADRAASEGSFPAVLNSVEAMAQRSCDPRAASLAQKILPLLRELQGKTLAGIHATHPYECEGNPATAEGRVAAMKAAASAIRDYEAFFRSQLNQLRDLDHDLQREAGEDPASLVAVTGKKFQEFGNPEQEALLKAGGYVPPPPLDNSRLASFRSLEAFLGNLHLDTSAAETVMENNGADDAIPKCDVRFSVSNAWLDLELLSCDLSFSMNRMQRFSVSFESGGMRQLRFCENEAKGGAGSDAPVSPGDHSDITGLGTH